MKRTLPLLTTAIIGCAALVPVVASAHGKRRTTDLHSVRQDVREARQAVNALERKLDRFCPQGCTAARRDLAAIKSALRDIRHTIRNARDPRHTEIRYSYPELQRKMRRARTDRDRISLLSYGSHLNLNMRQTCGLLVTFRAQHERLAALRIMQSWIIDPHNVRVLDEAFARRSDRRRARRIIRNGEPRQDRYDDVYAYNRSQGRGRRAR